MIVGGGALLSLNMIPRGTLDVDVIEASRQLTDLFDMFDFNTKVQSLSYCFPYHYQDRIQKIDIKTRAICFYTPAIEDLIVAKLYAYRPKDVDDIKSILAVGTYDSKLLEQAVADARASALNEERYQEMVVLYRKHF